MANNKRNRDKQAEAARTRAWRLANPEAMREQSARRRERIKADPERYAKYLEGRRTYCNAYNRVQRAKAKLEGPRVQALLEAARGILAMDFLDLPESRTLAAAVRAFDENNQEHHENTTRTTHEHHG